MRMTVAELLLRLAEMPQDLPVIVSVEGGNRPESGADLEIRVHDPKQDGRSLSRDRSVVIALQSQDWP